MEPSLSELLQRIERLEHIVDQLRAPNAPPQPVVPPPQPSITRTFPMRAATGVDLRSSLRFIGIALLLFGVVFLFKFSDNETDLVRIMRVVIGVAFGTGLVVVGRILLARDRAFAQVLTGGGIGVWYISGFAAYQLFALVPAPPAFAYMTVVTLLAFFIAVRQNSLPLAVVATLGGLATPLLIYDADRSALGVVLYVLVVATGAVAMHARRRWPALLWIAAVASGMAMLATQFEYRLVDSSASQRWFVQIGTTYLWAMFAVFAAASYIRATPSRQGYAEGDDRLLLSLFAPVYLVASTALLWNLDDHEIGYLCLAAAIVYALATARFFLVPAWGRLTTVHFLVASGMAAMGALLVIDGNAQHLAVATEAVVLRLFFRRTGLQVASHVSHALFVVVAFLVLRDLNADTRPLLPITNRVGLTTLWSIVAIGCAAVVMPRTGLRRVYFYAAHAGIMGWVLHQCSLMHNGQAVVTVIWGLYGVALLIVGLRRSIRPVRKVGLLT
ncbi:MAG TPA: DUF2339 domain-containing protein, partial [Candidatus Krumholzibacteria bacterium]|nr:DUF2339 domain-containing protein [Candidatus Krumholzibacteria bacterium]